MSFTMCSAALIAAAVTVAVISDQSAGKSGAAVAGRAANPGASLAVSPASPSSATPVRLATDTPATSAAVSVAADPTANSPVLPQPEKAARASGTSAQTDASPFRLESLPVLEANAIGLDQGLDYTIAPPPARPASRSARGRTPSTAR